MRDTIYTWSGLGAKINLSRSCWPLRHLKFGIQYLVGPGSEPLTLGFIDNLKLLTALSTAPLLPLSTLQEHSNNSSRKFWCFMVRMTCHNRGNHEFCSRLEIPEEEHQLISLWAEAQAQLGYTNKHYKLCSFIFLCWIRSS